MEFVWFILIGLVAGWLAGQLMSGGGYGVIGDIVLGVVGALLGRLHLRHISHIGRRRVAGQPDRRYLRSRNPTVYDPPGQTPTEPENKRSQKPNSSRAAPTTGCRRAVRHNRRLFPSSFIPPPSSFSCASCCFVTPDTLRRIGATRLASWLEKSRIKNWWRSQIKIIEWKVDFNTL